jgi:hypothetical protein
MSCSTKTSYVFQEGYNHSRNKHIFRQTFDTLELSKFEGKSFEDVFLTISSICDSTKGLGTLAIYDVTAAICRSNNIPIENIFLIGNGPKQAIERLGLQPNEIKIGKRYLNYVSVTDVKDAFQKKNISLKQSLVDCMDGDTFETYLCQWQKTDKN